MDLVMPRLDGVGAMRELRARGCPRARVIVLTSFADEDDAAARDPGRRGRLPAQERRAAGARARGARRARRRGAARPGRRGAARRRARRARRRAEPRERLTPREREVLVLIGRGFSNKRIARELGIAEKTVKTHVGHVLAKLGVTDRTQAALRTPCARGPGADRRPTRS